MVTVEKGTAVCCVLIGDRVTAACRNEFGYIVQTAEF